VIAGFLGISLKYIGEMTLTLLSSNTTWLLNAVICFVLMRIPNYCLTNWLFLMIIITTALWVDFWSHSYI